MRPRRASLAAHRADGRSCIGCASERTTGVDTMPTRPHRARAVVGWRLAWVGRVLARVGRVRTGRKRRRIARSNRAPVGRRRRRSTTQRGPSAYASRRPRPVANHAETDANRSASAAEASRRATDRSRMRAHGCEPAGPAASSVSTPRGWHRRDLDRPRTAADGSAHRPHPAELIRCGARRFGVRCRRGKRASDRRETEPDRGRTAADAPTMSSCGRRSLPSVHRK
jgi:hypothetical protein